jgi:thiol-disulfide isomerase/thioredoxin
MTPKALLEKWRQVRNRRWVRRTVDALIFLVLIGAVMAWQTRSHLSGVEAPGFELRDLSGQPRSLESLRGKPVMLVFWAPWCGVCKLESSNVGWTQRLAGDRAHVISVATAFNDRADVDAYVRNQGVDYPVLLDETGLAERYQVNAFPTVYFLDEEGRVKSSAAGYTTTGGMLWRLLF